MVVNKHLVKDLRAIGLWNTETVRNIINNRGSIDKLPLPTDPTKAARVLHLKLKYLTVFEMPQSIPLELSVDRGEHIDQTQSFNCFMANPTRTKLNAFLFNGWNRGIKTGMYYLRQKATTDPINMGLASIIVPEKKKATVVCNDEICVSCQS